MSGEKPRAQANAFAISKALLKGTGRTSEAAVLFAGRLCTGAAFAVKKFFFLILEKALIEASVSVAARPWPALNSLLSSPSPAAVLREGWVKVTPVLEKPTGGPGRHQVFLQPWF